jgi:hypothetical protein
LIAGITIKSEGDCSKGTALLYIAFGKLLCAYATVCRYSCQYRITLNELKTAITAYIRNILQADLQKVFVNKIKRVQACIDARGHHFQHLLYVHSDFLEVLWKFIVVMEKKDESGNCLITTHVSNMFMYVEEEKEDG